MVAELKQRFGKVPVALGIASDGKIVFELFTSPNGTWTLIGTRTNKVSCIVASGDNWIMVDPQYECGGGT